MVLTHEEICACISGLVTFCVKQSIPITDSERFLSYLPLAHIFDRWVASGIGQLGGWWGWCFLDSLWEAGRLIFFAVCCFLVGLFVVVVYASVLGYLS